MNVNYKGIIPKILKLSKVFHVNRNYQHSSYIQYVGFSPDSSKVISTGLDKTVIIRDARTGGHILTLRAHSKVCVFAEILTDDLLAISGSKDGTIKTWDLTTGNQIHVINIGTDDPKSFAISSDKKRVACIDHPRRIRIWSTETAELLKVIQSDENLSCVRFSPNNHEIVGSSTRGNIVFFNEETGKIKRKFHLKEGEIPDFAISSTVDKIVVGGSNSVLIMDYISGQYTEISTRKQIQGQIIISMGRSVYSATFTPDGKYVAAIDRDRNIKVIDFQTGRFLYQTEKFDDGFYNIAISADGTLMTGAQHSHEFEIFVWNILEKALQFRSGKSSRSLSSCAYSPNGNLIGYQMGSQEAGVFEELSGDTIIAMDKTKNYGVGISFSPNGQKIALPDENDCISIWDIKTKKKLGILKGHKKFLQKISFRKLNNELLTLSADQSICIWDTMNFKKLKKLKKHKKYVSDMAISPNEAYFATSSNDSTINLWDMKKWKLITSLRPPFPPNMRSNDVDSVAFSHDSTCLYAGFANGLLIKYNLNDKYKSHIIKAHDASITEIQCTLDGKHLITGAEDSRVKRWDPISLEQTYLSPILGGNVQAITIHPKGEKYAVGLSIGDILIFDF